MADVKSKEFAHEYYDRAMEKVTRFAVEEAEALRRMGD